MSLFRRKTLERWWEKIYSPQFTPAYDNQGPMWVTEHRFPAQVEWQKCPVCDGRGSVPASFYGEQAPEGTTSVQLSTRVGCRSCGGRGILPMTLTSTESQSESTVDRAARPEAERQGRDVSSD